MLLMKRGKVVTENAIPNLQVAMNSATTTNAPVNAIFSFISATFKPR